MGVSKKTAKGRLDKYYFLAKEQGYRARSAFKLVHLNNKYGFLEKARVLVDLCAAPGGWLQVAAKYMPVSRVIVGVDLVPIRPIPNVITLVDNITTDRCRSELKKELKTWKVDVVLHDGAPNVGKAWLQDAFSQAELVLAALKLATEFLVEGGTFVTKVFRSKDYNSLLWVFHQLFAKVEATKPASSRSVSAEIFVVCRGFLAPKTIDPKLLDARHVFEDIDLLKSAPKTNILHPEKKSVNRGGYEEGATLLYKPLPAIAFIEATDPTTMLATANCLVFEDDKLLVGHRETGEDIRTYCADLKVIGRKEFKALLKWRLSMRKALQLDVAETVAVEVVPEAADAVQELEAVDLKSRKLQKRERQKALERKAKQRLRLRQKMMESGGDLAENVGEEGLFSLRSIKRTSQKALDSDAEDALSDVSDEDASHSDESGDGADRWAGALEDSYRQFKMARMKRQELSRYLQEQQQDQEHREQAVEQDSQDEAEEDDASIADVPALVVEPRESEPASRAELFYANPVFDILKEAQSTAGRKQAAAKTNKDWKEGKKNKKDDEDSGRIVFVKNDSPEQFDEADKAALLTPSGMSLAIRLAADRKRARQDLVDDSFHRFAFGEDRRTLPSWFAEDEARHHKRQTPVTKEAVAALKEKLRQFEARPIKKVLEAKGRNKMRAVRKLNALKQKAAVIVASEDVGEKQKSTQVEKLMAKAKKTGKRETKLIIAKGAKKGLKGRPKGVKGHYKMVDRRMMKDTRNAKKRGRR